MNSLEGPHAGGTDPSQSTGQEQGEQGLALFCSLLLPRAWAWQRQHTAGAWPVLANHCCHQYFKVKRLSGTKSDINPDLQLLWAHAAGFSGDSGGLLEQVAPVPGTP